MNLVILSGGSGSRLWPLSNEVRSKQFLKIFKTNNGMESMVQRMYRMISDVDPNAKITIATSQNQVPQIKSQLGENVGISIEPFRRDTFPAIVLSCAYLIENGASLDESVVICPVDPLVDDTYFRSLKLLSDIAEKSDYNLMLMGIKPTYPSEKFGYIMVSNDKVTGFKEKPDTKTAEKYIDNGALWNSGVFAFKLRYIIDIAKNIIGITDYKELLKSYESLDKISFDYAVAEKEESIGIIKYDGNWNDLGTWNSLTEAMYNETSGNVTYDFCNNTHIINELGMPLVALGVDDSVIVATPDGILVSKKEMSSLLKDYVKPQRPMYEKRIWGEYKVLDYNIQNDGTNSLTKHLVISPGKHISYQRHHQRTEMWTFIEGDGVLILDGNVSNVKRGDSIVIKPEIKHAIKANSELHIIEVQIGDELTEEDIERFEFNFDN